MRAVAAGSRSATAALEVGKGLRRPVPERDRLLDLEVERHPAVVDAPSVLDRDEREKAEELTCPPYLLLGGQRSGPEAGERLLDRSRARVLTSGRRREWPREPGRRARADQRRGDAAAPRCSRNAGARIPT